MGDRFTQGPRDDKSSAAIEGRVPARSGAVSAEPLRALRADASSAHMVHTVSAGVSVAGLCSSGAGRLITRQRSFTFV
jgi:hypothetical protein